MVALILSVKKHKTSSKMVDELFEVNTVLNPTRTLDGFKVQMIEK